MNKIKILYVIDKLEIGGTQRHLARLAAGLDRGVFEPRVCCLQGLGPVAEDIFSRDIPVSCLGLKRIYGVRAYAALRRLARHIEREKIDVVHSYLLSANIFGTWAANLAGLRALASKRDIGLETTRLQKRASRWVNRNAHIITANSQAVARHILEEGGAGGDKIKVIYNGIPDTCFNVPDRWTAAASLAKHDTWRPDRPTVGIVANLKPVENHAGFLKAASRLLEDVPDAQFLIVGDGPLRADLEAEAKSLGICDRTTFFGEAADPRPLLAVMDVFVLCSLHEGFPNALLEAMAAGKAVLATENGGAAEVVRHGRNGFLIDPRDTDSMAGAAARLLRSGSLREASARDARWTVAAGFTIEQMVEQFEQLYADILVPPSTAERAARFAVPAMCW